MNRMLHVAQRTKLSTVTIVCSAFFVGSVSLGVVRYVFTDVRVADPLSSVPAGSASLVATHAVPCGIEYLLYTEHPFLRHVALRYN
jgi:hypothetical protein